MPIVEHIDKRTDKHYFQYGNVNTKYYFNPDSKRSRDIAYKKVLKLTRAIKANESKNKKG